MICRRTNGSVSGSTSKEDTEGMPARDGVDHEKNWTKKLKTGVSGIIYAL